MKRLFKFLGLALILLSIFACSLEIPETVEIKGNPKLEFAANMDFSKVFGDIISDGFGGSGNDITVLKAPLSPSPYQTLVIRLPLFEETFDNPFGQTINLGNYPIDIPTDPDQVINITGDHLLAEVDGEMPLSSVFSKYLEGFDIVTTDIQARVYFDGSDVVNSFKMGITFDGSEVEDPLPSVAKSSSGIEPGDEIYNGNHLYDPAGSIDVTDDIKDLLSSPNDTRLKAKIVLADGPLYGRDFENASITAELVIWFPLEIKAGASGSELKMDELNSAGDFISKLAEAKVLESINVKLTMEGTNPFDDAHLLIKDKGNSDYLVIDNEITDSINFALSKENIDYINDRDNFESVLSIAFPPNKTLGIPKILKISTISINARVSIDLLDEEDD